MLKRAVILLIFCVSIYTLDYIIEKKIKSKKTKLIITILTHTAFLSYVAFVAMCLYKRL